MGTLTKEALARKLDKRKLKRREKRAADRVARGLPPERYSAPVLRLAPNKMTVGRRDPVIAAMSKNELREMFAQAMRNTAEM